jgi:Peptidase inhibitor family I36
VSVKGIGRAVAFGSGAVAVLTAGSLILLPAGAGGGPAPPPECDKGELCVYSNEDYSGDLVTVRKQGSVSNALSKRMPSGASSVKNRRPRIAYLYAMIDGKGFRVCLEPREQVPSLDSLGFNDQANSSKNVRRAEECPRDLNGTCDGGEFCVYEHADYVGKIIELDKTGFSERLGSRMDDQASSARNKRTRVSYLYESPQGEPGARFCVDGHDAAPNLGPFNDIASATKLKRKRKSCKTG